MRELVPYILAFIFSLVALGLFLFVLYVQKRKRIKIRKAEGEYIQMRFQEMAKLDPSKPYLEQNSQWKGEMYQLGANFSAVGIQDIVLVHGTFAGHDPIDLFRMAGNAWTGFQKIKAQEGMQNKFWKLKNMAIKDLGNFPPHYVDLIEKGFGHNIKAHAFAWSSANHHWARIQGLFSLVSYLAALPNQRILLVGHSHAGQIFALLAWFLTPDLFLESALNKKKKAIINILRSLNAWENSEIDDFLKKIAILRKYRLDFVTLGTAGRYPWPKAYKNKCLHLINHRGKQPFGGSLFGVPLGISGDYIQQMALAGSDIPSPIKSDWKINKQLDSILGAGTNAKIWKDQIKKRQRLHPVGKNLLIDYQDQGFALNSILTVLGHGSYTRYKMLLFNFSVIWKHLYAKKF